ncbi:MAG: hypothetical protein A2381_16700 [Bdellovibrionales bacterium RIFOXYB1_FULL_37_110]|nr:MAG: hypothetical protein A2181_07705 [Bdellovibrionales bacterium RIFOXYA1_FULL_38_20]OFZ50038.1 MAG: hypothetical protein A2417_18535 [Bdellovibrionales bacterium RIFOXYC1_FULL_37_79]OFZ59944.1 MAG: hypothetical protein A2381_16700 [Bdellovibrionales bacterium RIFOXYB1_FULL_37_110]OFZ63915.1 MAG: hypothetical protein A2577_05890 [Bdellovibrionales bacterium RIFOXYD1_FULL_36_51]
MNTHIISLVFKFEIIYHIKQQKKNVRIAKTSIQYIQRRSQKAFRNLLNWFYKSPNLNFNKLDQKDKSRFFGHGFYDLKYFSKKTYN